MALRSGGTVWAWGSDNNVGLLGNGTTGTVAAAPVRVETASGIALADVVSIAARWFHSVAITSNGTAYACGFNTQGTLGDGTTTSRARPALVKDLSGNALTGIVPVAAGDRFSMHLKSDGTVWASGINNIGQFGDNTTAAFQINPTPLRTATGSTFGVQLTLRLRHSSLDFPALALLEPTAMDMKTSPLAILNDPALLRTNALIGGVWVETGSRFAVNDPATGARLADVANLGPAQTQAALASANQALPAWRTKTAKERGACLMKWFHLLHQHADDLARIMTAEQGKPLAEAKGEVGYGASFIEWFAEQGKRIYGETIPTTDLSAGPYRCTRRRDA